MRRQYERIIALTGILLMLLVIAAPAAGSAQALIRAPEKDLFR